MSLVKRTYVDQETVITAENLNAIQDAIIENEGAIEDQGEAIEGKYSKPAGGIPATDMASGVQTSLGKADSAYQKPSGGIPASDMASGVQTSLGNADSAYQKPSGGIPASDMASGVQTSLGKADSAYQKPSGGIPASDMASGVQTSLGKADSALQSSDIDNTLTVAGKAADAKKTGDEISDVKNTLDSVDTAIWTGGDLKLPLVWERGIVNENYQDASEARTDFARTKGFFVPQKTMVLNAAFVFANSNTFLVCKYSSNGTGESRTAYHKYTASEVEAMKNLQLTAGKKYRFCYIASSSSIVVDYTNMDNYITLNSMVLNKGVGVPQLADDLSQFFTKLTDEFGNDATPYRTKNIIYSIDGNAIELETSDALSYIVFDVPCADNHKYALYLELTGTLENSNYGFEIRLFNKTSGVWSSIGKIKEFSQTSGADVAETVVFFVGSGEGGSLAINASNKTGETIEGNVFLYDVTDLSNNEIGIIDFSSIGTSKTILLVGGGGQVENKWLNKKVVFYGDSITQGQYPELVQKKLGFNLVKNAIGGKRFAYSSSDPDFNAQALSSDTRIETLPSDADAVLIMGGTNDFKYTEIEESLVYSSGFDRTKLKGAIAYTIQKVQVQCPNAVIFLLTLIGGRGNSDPSVLQPLPEVADTGAGQGKSSLDIRNATIEVADYLNIPVIDTWNCGINGLNRNTTIKDAVHPTDKGHKMIARYIVNAIKNSSPL